MKKTGLVLLGVIVTVFAIAAFILTYVIPRFGLQLGGWGS